MEFGGPESRLNLWQLALLMIVVHTTVKVETVSPSSAPNGPIRLRRNNGTSLSYTSGRVQLVYNRQWGNICDDVKFGLAEVSVICHQLGYTGASSWTNAQNDRFGIDNYPTILSSVECSTSDYLVILQCDFSTNIPLSCTDINDVSVTCYSSRIL